MGDNVRFLCDNGSGGVGYSGANGFPFAYTSAPSDVTHPIAVSFQDCVEMYWRIKNWVQSNDVVVTDSGGFTHPMPSGTMIPNGANATRELDLIFPVPHVFSLTVGPFDNLSFEVVASINQSAGTLYPEILYVYDLGLQFTLNFNPNPPAGFSAAGSCPATVMGYSLTAYFYILSTITDWTVTGSFLNFDPVEWWPYAQLSNGLPIFDTATGAVIGGRSPLN